MFKFIKLKKQDRVWMLISGVFFILIIFLSYVAYQTLISYYNLGNILELNEPEENFRENLIPRIIDGVYVEPGKENLYPVAVIIDNHINAHPLSGLAKANLVYEAEVEGEITRYLAIFAGEDIKEIGPVRSVRPYFVDWALEFSSLFIHCGGSPEALVKIKKTNIIDLNEFYYGDYFWRVKNKPAPHNIFISSKNINKFLKANNTSLLVYLPWLYKKDKEAKRGNMISGRITIHFSSNYAITWKYGIINNEYTRYINGIIHKDANGETIKAKNIIIQFVESKVIDEELRLKIKTLGKDTALIFRDGEIIEGIWRKNNILSRTRFYDQANKEVIFNRGTTWIEIVDKNKKVDY